MKLSHVSGLAGVSLFLGAVVLACSGSTTNDGASSSSSGSNSDTVAAAEACGLTIGATYESHYEVVSGTGPTCVAPADSTTVLMAPSSDAGSSSSDSDAGIACTTATAGCTFTTHCMGDSNGYTTVSNATQVISTGTSTVTIASKVTKDSDGSVLSDCTLKGTLTKQ